MRDRERKEHEKKARAMLGSFMGVFCEYGLDGAYMRKLAAGAGVSDALLYRYFENKDDIIRQCTVFYHERIQRELTDICLEYIDRPELLPDKLLEYLDGVIDVCRFLLQVMAHPTYSTVMEETGRLVEGKILDVARAFQEKLGADATAAVGVSFMMNSIVNDYILKKSRKNFLLQMNTLLQLYLK